MTTDANPNVAPSPPLRFAGPYQLLSLPRVGPSPVKSIETCIGRRRNGSSSKQFFMIKMLSLTDSENETQDEKQGKMLLHTEYSLLSLVSGIPGVVQYHGFFKDTVDVKSSTGEIKNTTRYCLVLDCLVSHVYDTTTAHYINLQHYVIKEKRLGTQEALVIFLDIVSTVDNLHEINVVHRDLKLGNMILSRETNRVTLTNFCLGKHLICETDLLTDQRGSPAYISPEVLSSKPYQGKPSDIWALGVVLYTMLYGQFPFYDQQPHVLFQKIKEVNYTIPEDVEVPAGASQLLRRLLNFHPEKRFTSGQLVAAVRRLIRQSNPRPPNEDQIVPELSSPSPQTNGSNIIREVNPPDLISSSGERVAPAPIDRFTPPSEIERFLFHSESAESPVNALSGPSVSVGEVPIFTSSSGRSARVPELLHQTSREEPAAKKMRGLPSVRRLSEDAKMLTYAEAEIHSALLARHMSKSAQASMSKPVQSGLVRSSSQAPPSTPAVGGPSRVARFSTQTQSLQMSNRHHSITPSSSYPVDSRTSGRIVSPRTPAVPATPSVIRLGISWPTSSQGQRSLDSERFEQLLGQRSHETSRRLSSLRPQLLQPQRSLEPQLLQPQRSLEPQLLRPQRSLEPERLRSQRSLEPERMLLTRSFSQPGPGSSRTPQTSSLPENHPSVSSSFTRTPQTSSLSETHTSILHRIQLSRSPVYQSLPRHLRVQRLMSQAASSTNPSGQSQQSNPRHSMNRTPSDP